MDASSRFFGFQQKGHPALGLLAQMGIVRVKRRFHRGHSSRRDVVVCAAVTSGKFGNGVMEVCEPRFDCMVILVQLLLQGAYQILKSIKLTLIDCGTVKPFGQPMTTFLIAGYQFLHTRKDFGARSTLF